MRTPISLASLRRRRGRTAGLAGHRRAPRRRSAADDAIAALAPAPRHRPRRRPARASSSAAPIVDADGTTHTRVDRTFRGLPVIGGDLVVHQAPDGALEGASQTLAAPLTLATKPGVTAAKAVTSALAPSTVTDGDHRRPRRQRQDAGRRRHRRHRRGSPGRSSPAASRPTARPAASRSYVDARTGKVLRTEQQIVNVDGQGQSLYSGTVPLQVTQSGSTYQLKDATRGGTYTTDINKRPTRSSASSSRSAARPARRSPRPDTSFGSGTNANRESAGVDAQYGTNVTWDYFKTRPRPQRHLRQRHRLLQPRPLRQELRQRLLGRHEDDVRRRRRRELRPAGLARRGRPRDEPRRHREHRRPDLLRRVRRPQRGHLRHLRHHGRVLRGQRQRPGRLPDRRGVRPQAARRLPPDGQPDRRRQLAELLQRRHQEPRRPLLLGRGQPLLLPPRRGLGRQDDRRRGPQLADLQRLDASPASAATRPRRSGTAR